jgi:hypothetical protein
MIEALRSSNTFLNVCEATPSSIPEDCHFLVSDHFAVRFVMVPKDVMNFVLKIFKSSEGKDPRLSGW